MKENEINKIDVLYLSLGRNYSQRAEYSSILAEMDDVIKENVYIWFKMFIRHRNVGWTEVKDNDQTYEIPHQLNEEIYHLVYNYFFKEIKELEQERDKIMSEWLKQNKETEKPKRKDCPNCKHETDCKIRADSNYMTMFGDCCARFEKK